MVDKSILEDDTSTIHDKSVSPVVVKSRVNYGLIYILPLLNGCLIGVSMTALLYFSSQLNHLRYIIADAIEHKVAKWLTLGFCSAGYCMISAFVCMLAPDAIGPGIAQVKQHLKTGRKLDSLRVFPVKFISTAYMLASGVFIGPEGPCIHMGGMICDLTAILTNRNTETANAHIAAGAGAGFACSLNAPASAILFVLEELKEYTEITFHCGVSLFLTTFSAMWIMQCCLGSAPLIDIDTSVLESPSMASLPFFLFVGFAVGGLGTWFSWLINAGWKIVKPWPRWFRFVLTACVAFLSGAITGYLPYLGFDGGATVAQVFKSDIRTIAFILIMRLTLIMFIFLLWTIPGGLLAPILSFGAPAGALLGYLYQQIHYNFAPTPHTIAFDGMSAAFSAVVQANFTGIILIMETTNYWACFNRLILVSVLGNLVAYFFKIPGK